MRTLVSLAALALAGTASAAQAAPAGNANSAACAYDSLAPEQRESLQARTFDRMTRGTDRDARAPSQVPIDTIIAGSRGRCAQRHGWSAELGALSHEFAALALARDALRRMLAEQGLSDEALVAYHRAHRSAFGRALSAPQQAAFTASLETGGWAANDPSGAAIEVAVGYLRILNDLDHTQATFATALAYGQARVVRTAAR